MKKDTESSFYLLLLCRYFFIRSLGCILFFCFSSLSYAAAQNPFLENLQRQFSKSLEQQKGAPYGADLLQKPEGASEFQKRGKHGIQGNSAPILTTFTGSQSQAVPVEKSEIFHIGSGGKVAIINIGFRNNSISGDIIVSTGAVLPEIFLTLPCGDVLKKTLPGKYIDAQGNLLQQKSIPFSFSQKEPGLYRIELLDTRRYPLINEAFAFGEIQQPIVGEKRNLLKVPEMIDSMNDLRASLERTPLHPSAKLQKIANAKVRDMALSQTVGHISSAGGNILDIAQGLGYTSYDLLGENVAGGAVSIASLYHELLHSGTHRYNILYSHWNHVGIGIEVRDGIRYMVQIFSE